VGFLVYAVPAGLILRPHAEPVSAAVDGSWFLWVVGTQAVSIVVSVIDLGLGAARPLIAVWLWSVGIVLYLILAVLVLLRLLSVPNSPETMTPSYWIFMGATAVSVLAAAQILHLPAAAPALAATPSFVSGAAVALWSFGTWWIPPLLVFGVWRHLVRRRPLRYEAGVRRIVFPLGMYATASMKIADALDLTLIHHIGAAMTWVALTAWIAAVGAMISSASSRVRDHDVT
jgi:tellurite resistance protein TehA-like permease